MNRIFLPILIILTGISISNAQELSIQELWNEVGKTYSIQEKRLNREVQEEQLRIRKSERIPVIYGDVNLQRNLIIPTTPVPAIAFDPKADEGAILPLKFSTKWNSKAGIQLEWDLFNPTKRSQRKEDQINLEKAKVSELQAKQEWKIDATLAYASIVLATEQYKAALADSILYAEINNINKDRYEAGRLSSSEYIVSQQELLRKRINIHESWSILEEANLELGRYYPLERISVLKNNIEEIVSLTDSIEEENFDQQLISLDEQLAQIQLQGIKRQALPSLSFNAYYGGQYFSNSFNIVNKNFWYGYSYANLGLKIPISAYFTNSASIRQVALNEKIFRNQLEETKDSDAIDLKQKSSKIISQNKRIKSLEEIKDLAAQNKAEKLESYEAGRILLTEFNKANSEYLKSCQDLWQAKYDLLKITIE
ncbi:TolC family protein [Sphingobacterium sp. WM]|uniref:TolC family protein n=1 Tax=Sphingobacterium sp. WM TaxID=3031802 RepID=UPI00240DF7C8|nr:TolC family protein [Sphingobacterium sp. WM]WFB62032.1 TolC family protein [Sphingobacterium sp. WM]